MGEDTRMDEAACSPEERYAALVETLLRETEATLGSEGKKGFGSSALCINGKIFAMLTRERLVVKLPRQRVDALAASGEGERFDAGRGRPMKEWLSLAPTSSLEWLSLAREALTFVSS
jgi:TfoX/Sxy family transcriptional regulator of competence genes